MRSHNYRLAVFLLTRGSPLPVDLQSRLLEEGVDVQSLINRFN